MTKKKILLCIVLPIVIVALLIGGLFALRQYWQPFTRTAEFTVCGVHGGTKDVAIELEFHRWLFAPTSVQGTVTVDGVTYKSFELARGIENPRLEKPQVEGFWSQLKAKWQELQTSVVLQAYDAGYTEREYMAFLTLFSGDPFAETTETIALSGVAVGDDFAITAVWLAGDIFSGPAAFGPASSAEEAEQIKQTVFGIPLPFAQITE